MNTPNEQNEQKPEEQPLTVEDCLELLADAERRKSELARLKQVVAEAGERQAKISAEQLAAITSAQARVTIAQSQVRSTRNKLVVCAQCLNNLVNAIIKVQAHHFPDSEWPNVDKRTAEAVELIELLQRENLL